MQTPPVGSIFIRNSSTLGDIFLGRVFRYTDKRMYYMHLVLPKDGDLTSPTWGRPLLNVSWEQLQRMSGTNEDWLPSTHDVPIIEAAEAWNRIRTLVASQQQLYAQQCEAAEMIAALSA